MPVTSFALLVLTALVALMLALWAMSSWGLIVVPVLALLVLFGRWAAAPVQYDDSTPS